MMSEIEEIISIPNAIVYHLKHQSSDHEFMIMGVINNEDFRIFRENDLQKKDQNLGHRLALIKCKDWYYPLESDKTIVYRCRGETRKCYIFNDASVSDSFSILMIDAETDDDAKILLLENVFLLYASLHDAPYEWERIVIQIEGLQNGHFTGESSGGESLGQDENRQESTADVIAKNIVKGAEFINYGLTKGTMIAGNYVQKGASSIKSSQCMNGQNNAAQIDPRVLTGLSGLRRASQTACTVSTACVNAVASGTQRLGTYLAPTIKEHGTKIISTVSGKDDHSSRKICDDIFTVGAGGLQGFATLYNGITQNAIYLGKTVADETVDIVNRKYGNDAGAATHDTLYAAGNAAIVVQNVKDLGPKGITKRAAKDAGKCILKENNDADETKRIA